tara:strand:+ start:126 stop:962 length:837 start_codon:yes stop_codon:yes gene_type:complete
MASTARRGTGEDGPETKSSLPLIAITAALLVVGCALSYVLFWEEISSQMETEDWTEAQGVILSSGIESEVSCGGEEGCSTTYQPFAEYRYEVEGNSYEGSRIAFTWDSSFVAIRPLAESMIEDFQEGDEITVHVDPDDHGESVLIQGIELKSMSFPLAVIVPLALAIQPIEIILMVRFARRFGDADGDGESSTATSPPLGEGNWVGPDGTESGPSVAEDWYMRYDGPAPVVESIAGENYAVDRGNGAVPIDFYIEKWGAPEGFGKTRNEKNATRRSRK